MVALCCDASLKADLCASCSEKPMPDDREADKTAIRKLRLQWSIQLLLGMKSARAKREKVNFVKYMTEGHTRRQRVPIQVKQKQPIDLRDLSPCENSRQKKLGCTACPESHTSSVSPDHQPAGALSKVRHPFQHRRHAGSCPLQRQ